MVSKTIVQNNVKKCGFKSLVENLPFANRLILISIIPLSIFVKIVQYNFLPSKYFFDSGRILRLMSNRGVNAISYSGDAFNNSALLFKNINFFNLTTLLEWSILIAFITDIFLLYYFLRNKINSKFELIVTYSFLGLLNLYVFNLSKEIIQFVIFTFICLVIKNERIKMQMKYALICIMLILESVFFRTYYVLMAALFISISIIFYVSFKSDRKTGFSKISFLVIIALIGIYIFLIICEYLMPEEYQELLQVRNHMTLGRIGDDSAQTLILNLIPDNGNKLLFIVNYFINFVRILFPIELIVKGVYYWIFIGFQLLCTYCLFKKLKYYKILSVKEKMCLCLILAYYVTGVFFEPDFGSFVRHEAATAPIWFALVNGIREF